MLGGSIPVDSCRFLPGPVHSYSSSRAFDRHCSYVHPPPILTANSGCMGIWNRPNCAAVPLGI